MLAAGGTLEQDLHSLMIGSALTIQFYDHNSRSRRRMCRYWKCSRNFDRCMVVFCALGTALGILSESSWALDTRVGCAWPISGAESPSDWLLHDIRKHEPRSTSRSGGTCRSHGVFPTLASCWRAGRTDGETEKTFEFIRRTSDCTCNGVVITSILPLPAAADYRNPGFDARRRARFAVATAAGRVPATANEWAEPQ